MTRERTKRKPWRRIPACLPRLYHVRDKDVAMQDLTPVFDPGFFDPGFFLVFIRPDSELMVTVPFKRPIKPVLICSQTAVSPTDLPAEIYEGKTA